LGLYRSPDFARILQLRKIGRSIKGKTRQAV
jgi:hypothetical protein